MNQSVKKPFADDDDNVVIPVRALRKVSTSAMVLTFAHHLANPAWFHFLVVHYLVGPGCGLDVCHRGDHSEDVSSCGGILRGDEVNPRRR